MASVEDTLTEWASFGSEKTRIFSSFPSLVLRWANEAQLRFVDKSEMLRDLWLPTIDSTGIISLPTNFLREFPNKVYWTPVQYLAKIDLPLATILNLSTTLYYAIYAGKLYILAPNSGNPKIYYLKKPVVITQGNLNSADWEIPTEHHSKLMDYLDARFFQHQGDDNNFIGMLKNFDSEAVDAGITYRNRNDALPIMAGNWF